MLALWLVNDQALVIWLEFCLFSSDWQTEIT